MIRAGKLRHRITCDEPEITQSDNGEEVVTFPANLSFVVDGSIDPLAGHERTRAGQTLAEGSTRIRIRWSPNAARINAKWRLRHRNVIYNISGPPAEIDMGRREIEIWATSGVNAG